MRCVIGVLLALIISSLFEYIDLKYKKLVLKRRKVVDLIVSPHESKI